jgi:YaiO family outer membrane protein
MKNLTEKPSLTVKKGLFSFLGAASAVCALLQADPAVAEESGSTRPSAFDASPYIEAGYTSDYLTNHATYWHSEYVGVSLPLKAFGLLTAQGEDVERFGLTDPTISASYAYPFSIGVMTLDGRYADNPDFLAKNTVGLVWNGKLPDGLGYTLGAEQRQYEDAKTHIYSLGVEKNVGEFRFAYTTVISSIDHSRSELAHRMQVQWISAGNSRLGVTYSFGIEPEKIDQNTLSSIKTNYLQVDGLVWPVKRVGLVAAYWHGMEGSYYQRNGGQLGLRIVL